MSINSRSVHTQKTGLPGAHHSKHGARYREIPYSQLSIEQLIAIYNDLAAARGEPRFNDAEPSRCKLVEKIAILKTRPLKQPDKAVKKASRKKSAGIRQTILAALCEISHYEMWLSGEKVPTGLVSQLPHGTVEPVGYSYYDCLMKVQAAYPHSKTTEANVRWCATMAKKRQPGFECELPSKRARIK